MNDPDNASKVVDENGEPLVVYHDGSNISIFDGQHIRIEDEKYEEYVATHPNQIKSATDNNGLFSTENDDIQMMAERRQIDYITDSLSDTEKDDIRNALLKINRAGRTLVDTGEGLYLVDHTDKEGIDNRKDNQEGFQCVAKIDTEGLRKEEIQELKKELTDEIIRNKTSISGVLESHGYSERLQNSDSIDAEVRRSNADNAGLDQETSQGESLGELSNSSSQEDLGADFIKVRDSDGTNSKRVVPRNYFSDKNEIPFYLHKLPNGREVEVYGFIDPKTREMYLDDAIIRAEHPIHEYTHLWDRAVAERNHELWSCKSKNDKKILSFT